MQDTPLRGKVIAERYQVVGLIEDRHYSAVYQGKEIDSGALVLMKQTRQHTAAARERFTEELQRPISNAHLAPCLGWDWIDGNDPRAGSWQIFEWKGGRTLATWLAEKNNLADPLEVAHLMMQVCSAVEHLHQGQPPIIHKHIEPGNIGLGKDAEGHLIAFLREYGMADHEQSRFMHSTSPLPTTVRGAPELFSLFGTTDERTDIYAIGATLYELATGQRPTSGQHRHLYRGQVERADLVRSEVSRPLADVIERAMRLDAGERYASVAELRTALEEATQLPDKSGEIWAAVIVALVLMAALLWGFTSWDGPPALAQATPDSIGAGGVQPTVVLPTPLPTVPPTATPDIVATLTTAEALLQPIAGPLAGELPTTAAGPGAVRAAGPLADFAVEAVFVNPGAPPWGYGFAFRHNETGHFRLSVASDGTWLLTYRTEDPAVPGYFAETTVAQGAATLALGAGETNLVHLLVAGPYGVVTINGQPVAQVSLWAKGEAGDVYIAAGLRGAANEAAVAYRELVVRGPQ